MQLTNGFLRRKEEQISLLTLGVAVAVSANTGTYSNNGIHVRYC